MCNICVFAGTTEGRELVEFLAGQPVQATSSFTGNSKAAAADIITVKIIVLVPSEISLITGR